MFLAETGLDKARLVGIHDTLQFVHYNGVSRASSGGVLVLFWKKDFDLNVESSSQNRINILINKGKDNVWRFIGFYGALKNLSQK